MKRMIKSTYIPDMTERYPEGMGQREYDPYLDDIDAPYRTLRDALEDYMRDAYEGDYYNHVAVSQNGRLLYESNSLEDIWNEAKIDGMLDERLDSSWWHDADILFTLVRR